MKMKINEDSIFILDSKRVSFPKGTEVLYLNEGNVSFCKIQIIKGKYKGRVLTVSRDILVNI